MSAHTAARLALSLWLLCVSLAGLGLVLLLGLTDGFALDRKNLGGPLYAGAWVLMYLSFSTAGALIASRRPRNAVGWLLCTAGLTGSCSFLAGRYAAVALIERPGSLPGGEWAAWVGSWIFLPGFFQIGCLILLFPDGRFPSPGWRAAAWLAVGLGAIQLLAIMCQPGPLPYSLPSGSVDNPAGIESTRGATAFLTQGAGSSAMALMLGSAAALVLRFRAARGDVRQQIKWVAYAAAVFAGCFIAFLVAIATPWGGMFAFLLPVSLAMVPMAVGVAVLRYRLYDIDRLINRTLVYVALTAALAAVYLGAVVVLQGLFRALTGQESTLAVVVATLAAAALFQPLRQRIQAAIDRRFYRRKYDAQKTLAAFSAHLRDEVELAALTDELVRVVDDTMQPAHVSLWLRPPTRPSTAPSSTSNQT